MCECWKVSRKWVPIFNLIHKRATKEFPFPPAQPCLSYSILFWMSLKTKQHMISALALSKLSWNFTSLVQSWISTFAVIRKLFNRLICLSVYWFDATWLSLISTIEIGFLGVKCFSRKLNVIHQTYTISNCLTSLQHYFQIEDATPTNHNLLFSVLKLNCNPSFISFFASLFWCFDLLRLWTGKEGSKYKFQQI